MGKIDEITKMLGEHEGIRHYTDRAMEAVVDLENLVGRSAGWDSEQRQAAADKLFNLQQSMEALKQGWSDHCTREEDLLKPYLGVFLMSAVTKERKKILEQFVTVDPLLADLNLDELSAAELLAQSAKVRAMIENVRQSVDTHSLKMDSILRLLTSFAADEWKEAPANDWISRSESAKS